jgi:hypothetical protein
MVTCCIPMNFYSQMGNRIHLIPGKGLKIYDHLHMRINIYRQSGDPWIAKLVNNSNNYGLW